MNKNKQNVKAVISSCPEPQSTRDTEHLRITQELRIHQVELEMQSNELALSRVQLENSEARYKKMFDYAPIAYITLNTHGVVMHKNLKACEMSRDFLRESRPLVLSIHPEDHQVFFSHLNRTFSVNEPAHCDVKIRTSRESYIYVRLSSMTIPGETDACLTALIDMTEIILKEKTIGQLAYYDILTGLPNRMLFTDRLQNLIQSAKRKKQKFAVIFADLDNFKRINDTFGHDSGDAVLCELSRRISGLLRASDTLSRMGGDEFTLLLPDIESERDAASVCEKILDAIQQTVTTSHFSHKLSISLGIAIFPQDGKSAEELLKSADTAMYTSKESGKNTYSFFNCEMKHAILTRMLKEKYLRESLSRQELSVDYQPQIHLQTGEIRGFEALLRWNSMRLGPVSPEEFIPLAEEVALINPLGKWILSEACKKMAFWHQTRFPQALICVNISVIQLKDPGFCDFIFQTLKETSLPPEFLELEITESINMNENLEILKTLDTLRASGIRISLDDFGTGYSSLNYLKKLPIEALKLDKSYIQDLEANRNVYLLTESIINLSHKLGYVIVAEGVETEAQSMALKNLGCDYVQGFHYYRPMNAKTLESVLH